MRTLYVETNGVISWVIRQQGECQNVFKKKKKKQTTKQSKPKSNVGFSENLACFILKHPF